MNTTLWWSVVESGSWLWNLDHDHTSPSLFAWPSSSTTSSSSSNSIVKMPLQRSSLNISSQPITTCRESSLTLRVMQKIREIPRTNLLHHLYPILELNSIFTTSTSILFPTNSLIAPPSNISIFFKYICSCKEQMNNKNKY